MLSDQELQSLRNWGNLAEEAADEICALRAALAAQPAEPVARDAALNTLAQVFHNGEEAEGDDGAVMMVDLALWNEGCEALESLVSEDELAAPPGYVLVPIEPTQAILDAPFVGKVQPQDWHSHKRSRELMAENYRAMIAAAGDKP